jgi:hypothetical protein
MVCFDGADRKGGNSAWSLSPIFIARHVAGSPRRAAAGGAPLPSRVPDAARSGTLSGPRAAVPGAGTSGRGRSALPASSHRLTKPGITIRPGMKSTVVVTGHWNGSTDPVVRAAAESEPPGRRYVRRFTWFIQERNLGHRSWRERTCAAGSSKLWCRLDHEEAP